MAFNVKGGGLSMKFGIASTTASLPASAAAFRASTLAGIRTSRT